MSDEKNEKTSTSMISPIKMVTISRGTGDGGIDESTLLETKGVKNPNVLIQPITMARAAITRGARVYLQSWLGFITALTSGAGEQIGVTIAGNVFYVAAGLSVFPAVIAVAQNVLEILTRLDETSPKFRA